MNHINKIWVLGCKGLLGSQFCRTLDQLGIPFVATGREVDIISPGQLHDYHQLHRPHWIINCTGFTNVDAAETQTESAFKLNSEGPGNLAQLALLEGASLIHFSSDYVFDGTQKLPYSEQDIPSPQSLYGQSKLAGEIQVRESGCHSILIRTSWLFGLSGKHFVRSILDRMLQGLPIRVVGDQTGCPTYAPWLVQATLDLIAKSENKSEIFHVCNGPPTTWFDFSCEISKVAHALKLLPVAIKPERISTPSLGQPASRPAFSALATDKLCAKLTHEIPTWQTCIQELFYGVKSFGWLPPYTPIPDIERRSKQ